MLKTIHLGGDLAKEFKPEYKLDVQSVAEAVRAINAITGDRFKRAVLKNKYYRIVRGKDLNDESKALNIETLTITYSDEDFYICPVPAGSGDDGWLNIVLGVVLIVVAVYCPPFAGAAGGSWAAYAGEAMISLGMGLALTGVSQLMSPAIPTGYADRESPEEKPSYLFNGPTNTIEQGGPVPVVHGKFKIGSTVISAAIEVEDI